MVIGFQIRTNYRVAVGAVDFCFDADERHRPRQKTRQVVIVIFTVGAWSINRSVQLHVLRLRGNVFAGTHTSDCWCGRLLRLLVDCRDGLLSRLSLRPCPVPSSKLSRYRSVESEQLRVDFAKRRGIPWLTKPAGLVTIILDVRN